MSTTNTSFNNDTDMTKFKGPSIKVNVFIFGWLFILQTFLRVGWVFQTLQSYYFYWVVR